LPAFEIFDADKRESSAACVAAIDARDLEINDVDRDAVTLKQRHKSLDRFDPGLDAVGVENDVRHFRRQVPGQNAG